MISLDVLVSQLSGLQRQDLERWLANEWVRADNSADPPQFHDIDVARVRLILELRDDLQVNEEALPIVLSLLDQLYDQRRRWHALTAALEAVVPADIRRQLARQLGGGASTQRRQGED